jgi:hypothetical protein
MTSVFDDRDIEDVDGLLPELDELDSLPDVLGDYGDTEPEPSSEIDE